MPTTANNFTKYLAEQILKWAFTDDAVTRPTAWWAALMSTKTTDTVAGVEFSDADYGRVAVVMNVTGALTCIADNDALLAFGTPVADWPDIEGLTLYDAETDGNALTYYDLATPQACPAGAPVSVAAAALVQSVT